MPEAWKRAVALEDTEVDVVVVGFGGAGACAAIEAADRGADVLVVDRFQGGGATAISGGVVYAGGGTVYQKEAGCDDSVEAMLNYLRLEVGDAVSPATLERFCADSVANLDWLAANGVPFEGSLAPRKTSYPTNDYYLYYSGSEAAPPFRDAATPAPRGHRAKGRGTSGKVLFKALARAATQRRVRVARQTRVTGLTTDADGRVTGVECRRITSTTGRLAHRWLSVSNRKLNIYFRPAGRLLDGPIRRLEARHGRTWRVRARRGVILAAGGFVFNRKMLAEHAPPYRSGSSLGTIGDDGSGIRLGESAGGATARMHRVSAWRFFNPPLSLVEGVLVNRDGERLCNELYYGARIGDHIAEQRDAKAYLIIDQRILDAAKSQLAGQTLWFQRWQANYLFTVGHLKAGNIEELATRTGIDPAGLRRTLDTYNADARSGKDRMGKDAEHVHPLERGPFYAFDCSLRTQRGFPCPMITLGGLTVDEESGAVTRVDGSAIPGLYAAGRTAVGVCSESYVSGLSIADCVFSGRRAGSAAAGAS
ncbi:FAD-binding protein [Amycolatopsis taiwanensis]|uniref:23S rRNA methyltransferase n=1 Tax=Amycolatopsis taiwanensis TaxID=342230 RepID=A0A9W6QYY2_9PSEU|nr:FAD-binding protein [Amycolatopsis taiwanensis]GLY66559.1 23S rRNA methyltransferase [Amycolatopsis taiwanensis]